MSERRQSMYQQYSVRKGKQLTLLASQSGIFVEHCFDRMKVQKNNFFHKWGNFILASDRLFRVPPVPVTDNQIAQHPATMRMNKLYIRKKFSYRSIKSSERFVAFCQCRWVTSSEFMCVDSLGFVLDNCRNWNKLFIIELWWLKQIQDGPENAGEIFIFHSKLLQLEVTTYSRGNGVPDMYHL